MTPLTVSDQIVCSHNTGKVIAVASQTDSTANNIPILVIDDLKSATIAGCQAKPPCVKVVSIEGAENSMLKGKPVALVEKLGDAKTNSGGSLKLMGSPIAAGLWDVT